MQFFPRTRSRNFIKKRNERYVVQSRTVGGSQNVTGTLSEAVRLEDFQLQAPWPEAYERLRELARACLAKESADHTLQATALVHEVYLRLIKNPPRRILQRSDLIGLAARLMRQVLINHAKTKGTTKRGRGFKRVPIEEELECIESRAVDLLGLNDALDELRELDDRLFRAVELRFFGGLSAKAAAELLGMSESAMKREWAVARAWLYRRLTK